LSHALKFADFARQISLVFISREIEKIAINIMNKIFIFPFQLALILGGLTGVPSSLADEKASLEPHQEVISRQVIEKADGGTVTYNRVTPAKFAPSRPITPKLTTPVSAEQAEILQEAGVKKTSTLMLQGTTFADGMTLLEWREEGVTHRAVSNLDFSLLPDMGQFEADDQLYIFMLLIQETDEPAPAWVQSSSVRRGQASSYALVVDPGNSAANASVLDGLDALHSYFDANKSEIIDAHLTRGAENRRREEAFKANPPRPESPTINYWIRSENAAIRDVEVSASDEQ
jgi:hypothetical protein